MLKEIMDMPADEREAVLSSLPEEQQEEARQAIQEAEAARQERLEKLGSAIARLRSEAISARSRTGIEEQWTEDEEYYEGIDDANRGERSSWNTKPPGEEIPHDTGTSSTIFLNITRPYCDAAGASLADMLLPTDDNSWELGATPIPEFVPIAEGDLPDEIQAEILADSQGNPELAAQKSAQVSKQAKEAIERAKVMAEKTQKRIEDWHSECQYHAEVRKVIEDAARVGTGVLKGPFPEKRRHVAYVDGALVVKEEIKPASRRIHYRNLYPAEGCGESIHDGSYIFERDDITSKKLRDLIGVPGYDESQILKCLDEGATRADSEYRSVEEMKRRDTKNLFEIWYFFGELSKEDMAAAGCECEQDAVPAQIVMVNNRVIKGSLNPLDTGDFPYDVMVWQEQSGMPWGIGVSSQIRTPQRMINGAARNLMDNAGLAGGPMWAFKDGVLEPDNGVAELVPRKGWRAAEDANIDDVSKAFTYFKLDMMVNELMTIINLGLKMAEDVTGLPMIMQGQMGAQKLETLGQTQILNNNANIVRRRIARYFDDRVTEPHIRRYHRYHLQYGPDDEKGDFMVEARGSSNLVERAIQKEQTIQLLELANNPVYGLDPKKVAKEYLRSEKFDPRSFEYDDDEWRQIVENMANSQQASDPRVEIAQLNAEVKQMIETMRTESKERIEAAKLQAEEKEQNEKFQFEAAMKQFDSAIQKEVLAGRYKGDKDMLIDKLKVQLNQTVMKLKHTEKLVAQKAGAAQLPAPPIEPPGRAPAGESYQR